MAVSVAIILAAGTGTRLWGGKWGIPKCLVHVGGKTILQRQIENLQAVGVRDFIVVVGHEREMIQNYVLSFMPGNFVFVYNERYRETNTLYSLYLAAKHVGENNVFILNGDVVFDQIIIERMREKARGGTLPIVAVQYGPCDEEAMKARVHKGYVMELSKNIPFDKSAGEFVGVSLFDETSFSFLALTFSYAIKNEESTKEYYEKCFCKTNLIAMSIAPYMAIEIDTQEDLAKARKLFKQPYGGNDGMESRQ